MNSFKAGLFISILAISACGVQGEPGVQGQQGEQGVAGRDGTDMVLLSSTECSGFFDQGMYAVYSRHLFSNNLLMVSATVSSEFSSGSGFQIYTKAQQLWFKGDIQVYLDLYQKNGGYWNLSFDLEYIKVNIDYYDSELGTPAHWILNSKTCRTNNYQ